MRTIRVIAAMFVGLALSPSATVVVHAQNIDGIAVFLRRLEPIVQAADTQAFGGLLTDSADRSRALDFTTLEFVATASRAVIQERDREPLRGALPGDGFRLIVDVFTEYGNRSRVGTWRLDVTRVGQPGEDHEWAIADEERLSTLENLYRLALNPSKQFTAHDLKIAVEDLDLTLAAGSAFVAEVDLGVTGLLLSGKGTLRFHPDPVTEKGQVRIFCGNDVLESTFDMVFIRMNPGDYGSLVNSSSLEARPVDPRELKRAQDLFREDSGKSFVVDLGDLSRDPWTLLPGPTDFLAEMHTRKFDTLTYARSGTEAEDITVFDRKHHRNISIYPSKSKLASHGRFYNEDDLVDYDVLDYDIDVASFPERQWIEGRARLFVKVRSFVVNTITLKLADPLAVQSIVSNELGRLFGVRIKNQNTIIVNLPAALTKDSTLTLTVNYAGRLEPQMPDRETVTPAGQSQRSPSIGEDSPLMAPEASFLYSSRSLWYPQGVVSDYATARIRLTVPAHLDAVASGQLEPGFPIILPGKDSKDPALQRKQYAFVASQPLRYLAFIVSRFTRAETATIGFPEVPLKMTEGIPLQGISYRSLSFSIEANPRQVSRGRDLAERVADIATFYQSVIGDNPYSSFTVALVESELPGGHSPAYFASLNQPLPFSQLVWRNDPAAFPNFPEFFIAHEMAHQWWGQAVGWRNYHEQWISEGFAQYFTALYAQHARGEDVFTGVMRQLRRWGMDQSEQGPVYLGYRLGHIRSESRVFRALVYNKSAAVLHMLRGLIGDEAFFAGMRRFYRTNRFKKAGTEDFRAAMETVSGVSLERFFERWIYGSSLPRLKFAYTLDGNDAVLHVEQLGDDIFDFPLVVSLQYADRKAVDIVIPVTARSVEKRVPLAGTLRGIELNKDAGTLAEISKS
jgi:Peptidase family M1 domain